MKYLICGLGNPGPQYELTRHNIGFLVLDRLVDAHGCKFVQDRLGWIAELRYKGRHIHLLKPSTFMNLSGKAVNYWLQQLKVDKSELMVITDDIALPFGKLRLRSKGSSGGHNGLSDIERVLNSQEYCRMRFGIGGDFPKGKQADYVLSNFAGQEMDELPDLMDKACEGILSFATVGVERTMNIVNTK